MNPTQTLRLGASVLAGLLAWTTPATPSQPPPYRLLNEPSTHVVGKVKLELFVDFYCPHCHHFETAVLPELTREFGRALDVTQTGFPIIHNKPDTPFLLYEAARAEGRGAQVAALLFRTLHDDRLDIQDPRVEGKVLTEAGLNPDTIRKRLASGEPKQTMDREVARVQRYGVQSVPAGLIDGHILVEEMTAETLRPLIRKLLADGRL